MYDHVPTTTAALYLSDTPSRLTTEEKDDLKFVNFKRSYNRNKSSSNGFLIDALADIKTVIDEDGNDAQSFKGPNVIELISMNVILNERAGIGKGQAPAPAFRPQPKRSPEPRGNQKLLSNVIQVLDLHFLHCNGIRFSGDDIEAAVFADRFNFDKAYLYAIIRGSVAEKLESLGLDDDYGPHLCRLGCASLKGTGDQQHQRWLKKTPARFMNQLSDKTLKSNVDRQEWADLLAAAGLLNRLDIELKNNTLAMACSLIGRFVSDKASEYSRRLRCASDAIGKPVLPKPLKSKSDA